MRKVLMLTNGTISLEDGMPMSCVPSVPCHRSPEITNQSGYSYQACNAYKRSRKEKETEMHVPYLYENMFLGEADLLTVIFVSVFPATRID